MIWIVAGLAVFLAFVTGVWSYELLKLKKLFEANKRATQDYLEAHSEAIEKIAEDIEELKRTPADISDGIEKQIAEAKWQVFTKWVDNIVNYDPYSVEK